MIKYSIIIPVKAINNYVRETVPYILALESNEWELIILPNELDQDEWKDGRIIIVASGRVGPAKKRDLGATLAAGEILVFLDDDSYPNPDLLNVANPYFQDTNVVAIGGPAITPPSDSFWQKVSGAVFLSKYSGGNPERYISYGREKEIDDWPSVNFIVRKKDFIIIGGFNSQYWPGEDTKLCLDLLNKSRKKIIYVPSLIVWHHRREGLLAHLKQIGAYGIHRGYFARVYPNTSRKIKYAIPSIFSIFVLVSCFITEMPNWLQKSIFIGWIIYFFVLARALYDIQKFESLQVAFVTIFFIVPTHFWYGIRFIQGVCTPKLISRLR